MLQETTLTHLVMPEHLNPHGTLFAGQLAKWLIVAGVITATHLTGKPENIILVRLADMNLYRPIENGHLAVIMTKIAHLGKSTITVSSRVFDNYGKEPSADSLAVFVTVDKQNKPCQHGFELPADYIEKNRDIYEKALGIRGASK
jgi:acyl-CoA thioesterase YciA